MDIIAAVSAIPGVGPYVPYVALALLVNALVIAPSVPAPGDASNGFYKFVYSVVNKLAGNYRHASNAGDQK